MSAEIRTILAIVLILLSSMAIVAVFKCSSSPRRRRKDSAGIAINRLIQDKMINKSAFLNQRTHSDIERQRYELFMHKLGYNKARGDNAFEPFISRMILRFRRNRERLRRHLNGESARERLSSKKPNIVLSHMVSRVKIGSKEDDDHEICN